MSFWYTLIELVRWLFIFVCMGVVFGIVAAMVAILTY